MAARPVFPQRGPPRPGGRYSTWWTLFLFLGACRATEVDVRLRSSWAAVSKHAEAFEFLREISPCLARRFLSDFLDEGEKRREGRTTKDWLPSYVRDPLALRFGQLAVANKLWSPRIEMLRSIDREHRAKYRGKELSQEESSCPYLRSCQRF